ncbi:MAG TPA: hypothetical protein VFJ60_14685 [Gaiella sp.]|nr:hypothetical protein [Gaiella sp.]
MPKPVEAETIEHRRITPGLLAVVSRCRLDRLRPHAVTKTRPVPLTALRRREYKRCPRRSRHQLLAQQRDLDRRQVHAVLGLVLRQLLRDRHRAALQVEQVVRQTEPERLSSADLAGEQHQPRRVLGEPRRQLIQLLDRQGPSATWRVTVELDPEHRLVDPLSPVLRLAQHPLDELQLVQGRAGMLPRSRDDEVLHLCPTESRDPKAAKRLPHLRLLLIELVSPRTPPSGGPIPCEEAVDLLTERGRPLRRGGTAHAAQLETELEALGRLARWHRLSRERRHAHLIRPRPALADAHAALSPRSCSHSRTALSGYRRSRPIRTERNSPRAAARRMVSGCTDSKVASSAVV